MAKAQMTKEETANLLEVLSGLAEMAFAYFSSLKKQGFSEQQAMRIVIEWQKATIQKPSEATPFQQFLDQSPS